MATSQAHERLSAHVTGRVQGVGFRDFTRRRAARLGLAGWVRNEPDRRTVRLVAEGPRAHLEELLAALHQGPSAARVEHVAADWGAATGEFDGFRVAYG